MFVDLCVKSGIDDPVIMNQIRMLFIAECGRKFNRQRMHEYVHNRCVGCDHEAWSIQLVQELCQLEFKLHVLLGEPNG